MYIIQAWRGCGRGFHLVRKGHFLRGDSIERHFVHAAAMVVPLEGVEDLREVLGCRNGGGGSGELYGWVAGDEIKL